MRDVSHAQPPAARPRLPRAPRAGRGERRRPGARTRRRSLRPGARSPRRRAQPAAPPPARRTYTPSRTYTPPATRRAQRADGGAARGGPARPPAGQGPQGRGSAPPRHQLQLLAAAQTHTEAVLRAELAAARQTDAVDQLAGSVAETIGAAPAGEPPARGLAPARRLRRRRPVHPAARTDARGLRRAARHRRRLRLAPRRRLRHRRPADPRPPARGNLTCAHACSSPSPRSPPRSSRRPRSPRDAGDHATHGDVAVELAWTHRHRDRRGRSPGGRLRCAAPTPMPGNGRGRDVLRASDPGRARPRTNRPG